MTTRKKTRKTAAVEELLISISPDMIDAFKKQFTDMLTKELMKLVKKEKKGNAKRKSRKKLLVSK